MQVVGAVVIGYILAQFLDFQFFTESVPSDESEDDSSQNPVLPDPNRKPMPNTQESVWSNDDGLVHVWKIGIHMGGGLMGGGRYEYHYQIGNESGTSFTRENTAGRPGYSSTSKITKYSTEQEAIDAVLESENPPVTPPGGPEVQPEPEEPEDSPVIPPVSPPTGLGPSQGSLGSLSTNAAPQATSESVFSLRTGHKGVF
mgnify:FL=1